MVLGKYLNPKYDIAFKRIFGTDKNKHLLLSFLNEVLKNQIQSPIETVQFLKTVLDPEIASQKQSIVDVLCEDQHGVKYIIEMQVTSGSGFEQRAQFYAAKAYINQMQAGDKRYENLKEVIFIAIADYDIFPKKVKYKSEHVILDKESLENDLHMFSFTFVNLPKFAKQRKPLKDLSLEEKWYYFLKYAEETNKEELEELVGTDVIIQKAYDELDYFGWSEEEFNSYEAELKRTLDAESIERKREEDARKREEDARKREEDALTQGMERGMERGMEKGMEKGIEKGMEMGMEKGREEGRIKERLELAKKMLREGVPINLVTKVTEFRAEELVEFSD